MGGISGEQGALYLVCERMHPDGSVWYLVKWVIACVCEGESAYVCEFTTQQYTVAVHAVDLCSPGLGSADPGLITVYHSHDPAVTP